MSMPGLGDIGPPARPLRVIAYRAKSVRLACPQCGLRFSIDTGQYIDIIVKRMVPPPARLEADARAMVKDKPHEYLEALAHTRRMAEQFEREQRAKLTPNAPKPKSSRRIRFPKTKETY